jgi:hypothetical protein
MSDALMLNVRYVLISLGVGLLVNWSGGVLNEGQATQIVEPVLGGIITVGTWLWGNYVKAGTKAVPLSTASRMDVPTVSSVTGQVER